MIIPLNAVARCRCLIIGVAVWLATCLPVFAHDPGLSSANLELSRSGAALEVVFNERDLAAVAGLSASELRSGAPAAQSALDALARRAVEFSIAGQPQEASAVTAKADDNNNVEFHYRFPPIGNAGEVAFESRLLPEMSFGHRQAFAAKDSRGMPLARKILSGQDRVVRFPVTETSGLLADGGARFYEFFLLGIRHIATGYDHLLFLFGLLIVCRGLKGALLLITCFTLAHSLTLALSTFGLVNLPSRWVEAIIAASILYVGLENLVRRDGLLRGRWLLTFVFGLVHGLGFASVLHELGVAQHGWGAIVPLVAFNSGVEVGQLAVAALVLPIIWKLRQRDGFLRVGVPACSVAVAAAGAYWLIERTLLS